MKFDNFTRATFSTKFSTKSKYEIQVTRVKLSNFISSSIILNTNQMSICSFPSMLFYALQYYGTIINEVQGVKK